MTILVYYHSSPVTEVHSSGFFTSLPMSSVLPPEEHLASSLADVKAQFEDWKARVKATGKPAVVGFFKAHRQEQAKGARAPAGFDKFSKQHALLNVDKLAQQEVA
jgi:hypothetical protein